MNSAWLLRKSQNLFGSIGQTYRTKRLLFFINSYNSGCFTSFSFLNYRKWQIDYLNSNFSFACFKFPPQPNIGKEKLNQNRTENHVDAESVSPNEPRNSVDLVRFQRRRNPKVWDVQWRVCGAWIVREYKFRCGFESLLVIHLSVVQTNEFLRF
jgi:hypothetical protein